MKLANQLDISPFKEGLNVLKVYPGYRLGGTWSRPVSINLIITTRCNSKCETCDSWKLEDHENELTLDEFKKLAKETAEMDIPIVTIGGGEPTVRPDVWEIISAFKKHNRVVQLTTNALTLKAPLRQKLFDSGVDRVTVSVDSHIPDLYLKIRGVDGVKQVQDNLEGLLNEKPKGIEVDTNTVLCADNANTFLDTLDHLEKMGIPKINFSAVTTSGVNYLMKDAKTELSQIGMDTLDQIIQGLLERKRNRGRISASTTFIKGLKQYYSHPTKVVYPCYAGYLTLDVFQDGSVHGCGNLPAFANVREASLQEIWRSNSAQENRKNMAQGKCPNCYLSCKIELAIAASPKHLPMFAVEKIFSSQTST